MAKQNARVKGSAPNYTATIAPKAVARTRQDILSWNVALRMAKQLENPRWYKLQQLYDEIYLDAPLESQYTTRILSPVSERPVLPKPNGEIDEEQTKKLNTSIWAK